MRVRIGFVSWPILGSWRWNGNEAVFLKTALPDEQENRSPKKFPPEQTGLAQLNTKRRYGEFHLFGDEEAKPRKRFKVRREGLS